MIDADVHIKRVIAGIKAALSETPGFRSVRPDSIFQNGTNVMVSWFPAHGIDRKKCIHALRNNRNLYYVTMISADSHKYTNFSEVQIIFNIRKKLTTKPK